MPDKKTIERLDLKPDAWSSFERAVDVVAKSPPQHRISQTTKTQRKKRKPIKVVKV
jgi:hypothetical protein